jgi:hypothetical protein
MFDLEQKEQEFHQRAVNAKLRARTERPVVNKDSIDEYRVKSSQSRIFSEVFYSVQFFQSSGRLYVECQCQAGQNEFPCKHIYAAKEIRDELIKSQIRPRFQSANFTVSVTPTLVEVKGTTTDNLYNRSEINHRRNVSDGERVLQNILDVVRKSR